MIKQFRRFIVVFLISSALGWVILTILTLQSVIRGPWLTGYLIGQLTAWLIVSTTFWGMVCQMKTLRKSFFLLTFLLKNLFYLIPFLICDFYATFVNVWALIMGFILGAVSNTVGQCFGINLTAEGKNN